jgi:hypothetical protein
LDSLKHLFHDNGGIALGTAKTAALRLQCGFLFLIHASCTKIVHWLAVPHSRLQGVGERSRWKLKKRIALNLTFPVLNLIYLLFKFAHPLGERRLFLLARQLRSDSVRELYLNGGDCGKEFAVIGKTVSNLDDLDSRLGTLDSSGDFRVHLKTSNVELRGALPLARPSRTPCYMTSCPVNFNFALRLDEQNKLFDCQRYCIENMNVSIFRKASVNREMMDDAVAVLDYFRDSVLKERYGFSNAFLFEKYFANINV